jgi:hypothetical protein
MDRITDPEDQNIVIHCANMFYHLYGNIFRAISEHHSSLEPKPCNA